MGMVSCRCYLDVYEDSGARVTSYILDTDELAIVQSGGYEGSAYIVLSPQEPVFAARVNGAIPSVISFAQVMFDTVTTGAYTDVMEGMEVRISRTNDIRKAYFIGRVRKSPTSTILYINETSKAIADNDFIWITDNYPVTIKKRYKTFLDWDLAFTKPQPVVKNMDSAYVKLTTAATATFSFAPIGQSLAKGATIASYAWSIPGATYDTGSASTQDITITVNTPYNQHGRLTITDSNGVTNWFVFTLAAGDPNNPAHTFFKLCHEPIPMTADWANGYSTNVLFWRGFDDALDGSRVTVVVDERFNGGTLDDISPVRFVGYLKANSTTIRGDQTHGQIKEASVEIASFLQIAGKIHFDPIAIRHDTTPTAWDQIDTPTPARATAHLLRHSTLLNVCAMDFGTIDDTYFSGNANISDTSLMDAEKRVASEINVYVTQGGAGMLSFERDPRVMTDDDRDAVPEVTPTPINLASVVNYKMDYAAEEKIGSMEVGFAVFMTTLNTRYYLTAMSPASGFGEGEGQEQIPNQLLAANSDLEEAKIEAGQRTGHLHAIANTQRVLDITFGSGWGFINPSPGEWYTFEVDAEDDPRGVGIAATDRWLCLSKSMTINSNGTQDVNCKFTEETRGGSSLIKVSYNPSVIDSALPVLPVRAVMGAFPPLPSINYDTTDPTDVQPRNPSDGWNGGPYTPEEAADAAQNQSEPGCKSFAVSFAHSANVGAGFTSVLGATYNITASGSARITERLDICTDFTETQGEYVGNPDSGFAEYFPGQGLGGVPDEPSTGTAKFSWRHLVGPVPDPIARVTFEFNQPISHFRVFANGQIYTHATSVSSLDLSEDNVPAMFPFLIGLGGFAFTRVSDTIINRVPESFRVTRICLYIDGDEPLYADPLYQWNLEGGEVTNVSLLGALAGLFFNNATAASSPPPYNDNHEYDFTWEGDGNIPLVRFQDPAADWSDNENKPLTVKFCGPGAGS